MSQKVRKAWNPETSLAHNGFIKLIVVDALLQTNYVGNLHFSMSREVRPMVKPWKIISALVLELHPFRFRTQHHWRAVHQETRGYIYNESALLPLPTPLPLSLSIFRPIKTSSSTSNLMLLFCMVQRLLACLFLWNLPYYYSIYCVWNKGARKGGGCAPKTNWTPASA